MSTAPTAYGWVGSDAREIEPTYTPDLAGEIDGDGGETETDFYVAAELLREILSFCYAFRGDNPRRTHPRDRRHESARSRGQSP